MSRPTGVTILAILQLLGAIVLIAVGSLAVMAALLLAPLFLLLGAFPLIFGIIGIILFYGLWNMKSWAWLWTIIVNLLTIITSLFDVWNSLIQIIISLIIVIYLFTPDIKSQFR